MFKKQFFPETTISAIATNQTLYERGFDLFTSKKIEHIFIDEDKRSVEITMNDDETEVKSTLSFLENGLAQKYSCDCEAFKKQSGACEHVIASIFYLNNINQDDFYSMQNEQNVNVEEPNNQLLGIQKNRQIIDSLFLQARKDIEQQMISFTKKHLKFEYVLNMEPILDDYDYKLFLRIGTDHLYVIQDIIEVSKALLKEEEYTFGKQLTYNPKEYFISAEDRKILTYIYEIGTAQENLLEMYQSRSKPELDGVLNIPPQNVAKLLNMLTLVDGGYVRTGSQPRLLSQINNLKDPQVVKLSDRLPLTFIVKEQEDYFILSLSSEDQEKPIYLHRQVGMINIEDVYYILEPEEFEVASMLLNAVNEMKRQPMKLTEKDLTSLYSLLLSKMKHIFSVDIEEKVNSQVNRAPLEPRLNIDYIENELKIEPIFEYGSKRLNPLLTDQEEEKVDYSEIIVRDVFDEADLLNVINHFLQAAVIEDGQYIFKNIEDISMFIYDHLTELSNWIDVYLTAEVERLFYKKDLNPSISIEIDENTNLLNINFDVADITESDLPGLIRQLKNDTSRFYKLKSGQILDLEKYNFDDLIDKVNKLGLEPDEILKNTSVSFLRGLSIVDEEDIKIGDELRKFIKRLENPENLNIEIPSNLQANLRPYQETGFRWLKTLDYYGLGGVLADDMGLGKTIQTIAFILSKIQDVGGRYLIVCPSSVLYNWENEFKKFAPSIKTKIISGKMFERKELIKEVLSDSVTDVVITSYPLIQRDISSFDQYQFQTIILDESQNVKNEAALTTRSVRKLKTNNIFALSGTPIENNLDELWSLFSIVLPGLFHSKKMYGELSEEEISNKINMFILRRLKEDVLEDLPDKTETIEYIELSDGQKRLYQTQLSLIRSGINEDEFEENRMKILAGMTRLRQICCDPRLVDPTYEGESAKLDRLMEYLEEAFENNKRVVLFSQFTSMLEIIKEILDKQGVEYHYLDGGTDTKERLELTTRFNDGEKNLFLISLRAGGTGLNLTGGDTVILYDSWWNPAIEDQAADRVHRFGQKNSVQVIRMIMKGTIEEGINELQDKKRELIDSVIHTEKSEEAGTLTKENILRLLSH